MKLSKFKLILIVIIILATAVGAFGNSGKKRILYLNSYQNGYPWSDDILSGIRGQLSNRFKKLDLQIEYMDAKKYFDPQITRALYELYRNKYRNTHFDVIITSDNHAFEFAMKYRDTLFPGVPIVFCGLNNFRKEMLEGHKGVTGIVESIDFKENLEIAQKLHPGFRQMMVIANRSFTSDAIVRQIKDTISLEKIDFKVTFFENLKVKDLKNGNLDFLKPLPRNTILYVVPVYEELEGEFFTAKEIGRLICNATKLPVYSSWDFLTGTGIVGGKLASGLEHGKTAGKVALRILDGEDPEDIPVVKNGGQSIMFDYTVLKKFGISKEKLPEGSIIINEPYNFYKLNRGIFWIIIFSVIILSGVVVLLILNIIQRKKANVAMKESREKLRLILDNIPQLVFWQDHDLKFVDVNKSFLKFFNLKNKDMIIGSNDYRILNLGNATKAPQEMGKSVLRTNKPMYGIQWKIRRHNREIIWLEINKIPLLDGAGRTVGILSTAEDITKKISLEKQLIQSQKMEALGILSGGIAHDFNNILTSIINSTELAIDDVPEDSITRKDLDRVLSAGTRGSNLVKQILTFSRPGHMEFRPIFIKDVICDALELLKTSLPGNIDIRANIGSVKGLCEGDPTQIHQIVMNLCTNSFQAMKNIGGRLEVGLRDRLVYKFQSDELNIPPGYYVELKVTDNGPGIDGEIIDKIFDPFFTTKSKNIGTGLGLSMVHGIVQGHKGGISVTSIPFEKTEFKIYIPQIEQKDEIPEYSRVPSVKGEESILFVEDDEDQRESVPRTLEKLGYKVTPAEDAEQALQIFCADPGKFDLIITDFDMPRTNGVNLAKHIARISPQTPIIMISGRNVDFNIHESDNIRKFVVKPYNKTIISEAIRSVMSES